MATLFSLFLLLHHPPLLYDSVRCFALTLLLPSPLPFVLSLGRLAAAPYRGSQAPFILYLQGG